MLDSEWKGKEVEEKDVYQSNTATTTHPAFVPGRALSGIVWLCDRPDRSAFQHAGDRRFA